MPLPPDSINALMVALKRREGSAGLDGMSPRSGASAPSGDPSQADSMADPSDDTSAPDTTDPDTDHEPDADTAKTNAAIVGVLQSSYPKIFAKISAQVEDDPDAQQGPPDGDDAPPPGMTGMQP